MFFDELNDDEWALLSALVSDEPAVRLNRRGRPRAEPRIVTNAVLWILTTGEPWSKLPGRYPSGPTCRRRFEEWQLNGTLAEVVQLLSQAGRRFAYIPEPSSVPVAPQRVAHPAHQPVTTPSACDDEGVRGVFWKSPESWQAPHEGAQDARPVDPFAEITRQLSGSPDDAPTRANGTDAVADHAAAHQDDGSRAAMWLGLSEQGTQFADRRGYGIYVMAQSVPGEMYRAWAEIMKDGKRVERSGLVGPRFETPEAAEQYALEWAQQWIDRDESTLAAAAQADTSHAGALRPVSRPMPAPRPAATSASGPVVDAAASAPAPSAAKAITQPVTVTSANMHVAAQANVNAHRIPLRRYPESTRESSTEDSTAGRDRFAPAAEFISHAG